MRHWAASTISTGITYGGLSPEDVTSIEVPTLIISGVERTHPLHTAQRLHDLIPNSQLVLPSRFLDESDIGQWLEKKRSGNRTDYDNIFRPAHMSVVYEFIKAIEKSMKQE